MVHGLVIIKKPRGFPLRDIAPSFKPFDNLHLEMLENKRKLKRGLPKTYIVPKRRKEVPREDFTHSKKSDPPASVKRLVGEKARPVSPPAAPKKPIRSIIDDDDFLAELGDDDEIEIPVADGGNQETVSHVVEDDAEDVYYGEEGTEEGEPEEEDENDPTRNMSPEEKERYLKEEMIWRFRILKKQYKNPSVTISEYNEHSDLDMMKQDYERTVRMLTLDDNVESYRSYLMGSFIVMEFVCTQWAGIDLSGFTKTQTMMMHKYERLLIELGEKRQETWSSNLPVEVRLVGMVLMQAGIFYLGKIVSERIGGSVADLFSGMMGQPPPANAESGGGASPPRPKKKMRGPSMNVGEDF